MRGNTLPSCHRLLFLIISMGYFKCASHRQDGTNYDLFILTSCGPQVGASGLHLPIAKHILISIIILYINVYIIVIIVIVFLYLLYEIVSYK